MPYARTFGALTAIAAISWIAAFSLLFFAAGHSVPEVLFIFALSLAMTLTIVSGQIWVCSFAARGRANLTESIRKTLKEEAEGVYWRMYSDVCEAVLVDHDGNDGGGAQTVQ